VRELHVDRHACPGLDGVLSEHPGVSGGAAGEDDDAIDLGEDIAHRVELGDRDGAVVDAAQQSLADRLRLLADLLLHEARPAALLGGGGVPLHLERAGGNRVAGEVGDLDRIGADRDDLVLADLHRLVRELDEGGHIAAEEVLPVAQPDHQR
jgi:hypothetical protein